MINLTFERAVELAQEALAAKPEGFTYEQDENGCTYTKADGNGNITPDCLVGDILHRAGVPLGDMHGYGQYADALLYRLRHSNVLTADLKAVTFLGLAQRDQDQGVPWADAISDAKNSILNLS